jgi:hypothetical protein
MERSGKKESGDGDIERRNHRFQIIFYHAHYITDEQTSQREFSFQTANRPLFPSAIMKKIRF